MKIINSYFNEEGKTFEEIMNQLLVLYYNEKVVKNA